MLIDTNTGMKCIAGVLFVMSIFIGIATGLLAQIYYLVTDCLIELKKRNDWK